MASVVSTWCCSIVSKQRCNEGNGTLCLGVRSVVSALPLGLYLAALLLGKSMVKFQRTRKFSQDRV